MIEQLALKHDLWVKMATGICKDPYLADDLVSEMYLKLMDYNKEVNDYYVYFTIKHIFINWIRQENRFTDLDCVSTHVTDDDYKSHENAKLPDCLTWVEKQILILRQEQSSRDIEKQYRINYVKVHRIETKAKQKLTQWAEELKAQGILLPV